MMRRFFSAMMAVFAVLTVSFATPASAGVDIRVNLASQTLTATTPDGVQRKWAISSGRKGYPTIRGTYRPYVLKTYHWSRKYQGAMPHAIFFKGGFAIHGTSAVSRLGAPASHGCIRLAPGNARELFSLVKQHGQGSTRIAINGIAPDSGRTMVAGKKQNRAVAVARAKVQPQMVVPAFAPMELVPNSRPFQRLR
jgi:L,D-transpeptidase catalytic domain